MSHLTAVYHPVLWLFAARKEIPPRSAGREAAAEALARVLAFNVLIILRMAVQVHLGITRSVKTAAALVSQTIDAALVM